MQKKKITKTLKKNKVEFISAEFIACCWVLPLDKTLMLSAAGAGQCQILSIQALGSLFKVTSDPQFVAVSFWVGCFQDGPYCSVSPAFYQYRPSCVSTNH